MHSNLPTHLQSRARELEADIRRAFAGVTRDGGVSWSEARVIDGYGSDQQRAEARAKDLDRSWEELAEGDGWWDGESWVSNFSFLDPIGFRYYLPAAMIRGIRGPGIPECLLHALSVPLPMGMLHDQHGKQKPDELREYVLERLNVLSRQQSQVVARYVRFVEALCETRLSDGGKGLCEDVYRSHWYQFGPDPTRWAPGRRR